MANSPKKDESQNSRLSSLKEIFCLFATFCVKCLRKSIFFLRLQ